jgi:hypothetical protein
LENKKLILTLWDNLRIEKILKNNEELEM